MMISVRLRIRGRVQGVGYRAWLAGEAASHRIRGWVRNRPDGSVEALLLGDAGLVESLIVSCHRGPPLAQVTGVERQKVLPGTEGATGTAFRQLPTSDGPI